MRKIEPPVDQVRPTLQLCVSRIEDVDLKTRAESIGDELEVGESIYRDHASKCSLFKIPGAKHVGKLTAEEMVSLYDQRLSKKDHPARKVYDALRAAAKFNTCPLCGHRQVATLDHYLPKTSHPHFAITPLNLVPSCSDCNKAKLAKTAAEEGTQSFHPYFDDFQDRVWLFARVIEDAPPAVIFFVGSPDGWSKTKVQRVNRHFSLLGLGELYGSNAAQELAQISVCLDELADHARADGVRTHLEVQSRSRADSNPNSWQAAMYAALTSSSWFWSGGHRKINT